jgi:HAMP domain-containing protein
MRDAAEFMRFRTLAIVGALSLAAAAFATWRWYAAELRANASISGSGIIEVT